MRTFCFFGRSVALVVSLLFEAGAVTWGAESSAKPADGDALARAEALLALSRAGKLDARGAAEAAGLLDHGDPFVAGVAEWTLANKVNSENNGHAIVWPQAESPAWYSRWSALDGDFLLAADYVRQAVVQELHRDGQKLLASVDAIIARARAAAGPRADAAPHFAELQAIRERLAANLRDTPHDLAAQCRLWLAARHAARPIVLSNRALDVERLVFVKQHAATFPNITGSQYSWGHKPGGGIYVQDGLHPGGRLHSLLPEQLGPGHVHGMDLHWNADRVVFGYARQPHWPPSWDTVSGDFAFLLRGEQEPTHLYEIGTDGRGLRQVTDHTCWNDFEPTYLPDDGIAFASDRSGRSSECGKFSADHTVINLYAVDADGGRLWRLSDNKDIDRYPHTLDNGLLAYTRWEYQERHFLEVHAIWTVRPDGRQADAVFKQHLRAPYGLRDTRSVPGGTWLVSVATGHHTLAYGPVVLIDTSRGLNDADAIRIVTPGVVPQEGPMAGSPVPQGGVPDRGGVYQTPWALSDECFLAAYSYTSEPRAYGFAIYVLDVHGNKELVSRDLLYSCSSPQSLRPRPRPPQLPEVQPLGPQLATCFLADVYAGLPEVKRGQIKHLRISQRVGWPLDERNGAMRYIPGNAWEKHFGFWEWAPVRVLGTVPVDADGSAHFTVPPDTAVYFQALDENFMEVRRMRSHVSLQAGEVRGCVGCHESTGRSPLAEARSPTALLRLPDTPVPPSWGDQKLLGYEWLVQPILERHCTRCHGADKRDGQLDLSATVAADGFFQSFRTLFGVPPGSDSAGGKKPPGRVLVSVSDRFSGAQITRPFEFGSPKSPFIRVLLDDDLHRREVALEPAEWQTLVTWVDANAPYHDRFFNRRPPEGGEPRREIVWTR